eukprot:TRINITY_DN5709_c0_g2_i1.p1 TRINITY_DN5709_c0_g2~~TRINITY_DN5709_c0_g2_i1.p1  ORF type:complete len:346 (-),score=64.67 TRINITY_DN5709_c0_g2_i1:163-1200(-)
MSSSDFKAELEDLRNELEVLKTAEHAEILRKSSSDDKELPLIHHTFKPCRHLSGHFGKVYALQWFSDSKHLVSASQDGKLILWNAFSTAKTHAIALTNAWVMTCAAHPRNSRIVASAGLDHLLSVWKANEDDYKGQLVHELFGHTEWISQCRFTADGGSVVTSSGDKSAMLWDVEKGVLVNSFLGHFGDVLSVSLNPEAPNVFATSGCDMTVRLWDIRQPTAAGLCIVGHEADVNAVKWFPDGNAVGTASDDSTCRLSDVRTLQTVNVYFSESFISSAHALDFSKSGRTMFVACDDWMIRIWDTAHASKIQQLDLHENRVSFVETTPDGEVVATCSWDHMLTIFS